MGRRKIRIARIQEQRSRNTTFQKRKAGVMKKGFELATLCGADVAVLIVYEGKVSHYSSTGLEFFLKKFNDAKWKGSNTDVRTNQDFASICDVGESDLEEATPNMSVLSGELSLDAWNVASKDMLNNPNLLPPASQYNDTMPDLLQPWSGMLDSAALMEPPMFKLDATLPAVYENGPLGPALTNDAFNLNALSFAPYTGSLGDAPLPFNNDIETTTQMNEVLMPAHRHSITSSAPFTSQAAFGQRRVTMAAFPNLPKAELAGIVAPPVLMTYGIPEEMSSMFNTTLSQNLLEEANAESPFTAPS